MIGAITGDIIGSVYEFRNIKTKNFKLFKDRLFFTDDTVMTCAVAEALMNGGERGEFITAMKKYGRMYPSSGYGGHFIDWIFSDSDSPYYSFGNGSAMRVSPCGWISDDIEYCREKARLSAEVTHNHPEGIKGALAVADSIFICRTHLKRKYGDCERSYNNDMDECKKILKKHIESEYGYDLSKTIDEIRPGYIFNETCQGSVPQAITAFLESTDYEDAVRNAISIGGDSDTIAAITGSIAEAAYGVPEHIKEKAYTYLDETLINIIERWNEFIKQKI